MMRSIPLLLGLILIISRTEAEESKDQTLVKTEVKYVGPIVYSDEKPPIVVFPTPPQSSVSSTDQNANLSKSNIEYVPFPYQDLPVLIYKSKDNPPIHIVSDSQSTNGVNNLNNSLSNFDKRLGETPGTQRGGRALKWSNFKLFSDKPVKKSQKWTPTDQNRFVSMSQTLDMNNNSMMTSASSPVSLSAAPHVIYSGHPPIHVFPQPIILKEPEFSDLAAASEPFPAMKSPNGNNFYDISMSTSNRQEVSTSPPSSQFYAYGGSPAGSSESGKSYGFRVKTRGNKHDTDYSSSTNYDNYDDSYTPQHSDGSDSHSDSNKFRPSSHYSNSLGSDSSDRDYDKDYDRPSDSYSRDKSREKYSKYGTNQWLDNWDNDNGWLSSLLGYNRYVSRPRRPVAIGLVNSPTNEQLLFAASQPNPLDMESLALMSPYVRHNGWVTGINPIRQTATAIRPMYSLGGLHGYRRPPPPHHHHHHHPHPTPYYGRFNPGMAGVAPAGSTMSPMAMKPMGFVPPIMGMPSVAYPVRIPYSPFMMYGLRRPPLSPSGDLAFAESGRNVTNHSYQKWPQPNPPEDIQMSGSHIQPTYVMPSAIHTSASAPSKPPIIIYQGVRPPVHIYKKPNATTEQNAEPSLTSVPVFENFQNQNTIPEERSEETTTTSTPNPYLQLFSTAEPFYISKYRPDSSPYLTPNSGFSPRHSTGDWIPVKQEVNGSKDGQQIN